MPSRSRNTSSPPRTEPSGSGGHSAPSIGELRSFGELHLLRKLGSGGMSDVYLGYHPPTGRTVAVKILADHLAGDKSFVQRFGQEASLSRKLQHRNLVHGLACGRDPLTRREFMVMEFVDGPTAHELLEARGRLPVSEAVRITLDIARALEYLHQEKYVHRDIKPGNVLIAPDGTAKLADLGVAKSIDQRTALTSIDQGIGTPYYMPWEQSLNAGLVDERSDLFALGATLYHFVTGRVPFPGDTDKHIAGMKDIGTFRRATDIDPFLPKVLDTLFDRLLVKDPRKRFRSASELIDVLTASGLSHYTTNPDPEVPCEPVLAPTRPDVQAGAVAEDTPISPGPVWLLRYRGKDGGPVRRHRGTTADIIRWCKEGVLPENAAAARPAQRRFRPLHEYREFRTLQRMPERAKKEPTIAERAKEAAKNEWLPILSLWFVCITGLLSVVLSASLIVWLIQNGLDG